MSVVIYARHDENDGSKYNFDVSVRVEEFYVNQYGESKQDSHTISRKVFVEIAEKISEISTNAYGDLVSFDIRKFEVLNGVVVSGSGANVATFSYEIDNVNAFNQTIIPYTTNNVDLSVSVDMENQTFTITYNQVNEANPVYQVFLVAKDSQIAEVSNMATGNSIDVSKVPIFFEISIVLLQFCNFFIYCLIIGVKVPLELSFVHILRSIFPLFDGSISFIIPAKCLIFSAI
jgi:hypothetical protein